MPAITETISATDASIDWGMKSFPEGEATECAVVAVAAKIDISIAPSNANAVNDAIATLTPNGNGTPTGDALKQAVAYVRTLPNSRPKFLLLATDGEPTCAGTSKGSTEAVPFGGACEAAQNDANKVEIIYGCRSVPGTGTSQARALSRLAGSPGSVAELGRRMCCAAIPTVSDPEALDEI